MAASGDKTSDVVLRLSLQTDPAEAGRMARLSGDAMKRETEKVLGELASSYERTAKAMGAQAIAYGKLEIAETKARLRVAMDAQKLIAKGEADRMKEAAAAAKEIERLAKQEEAARIRSVKAVEAERKRADREVQTLGRAQAAAIAENKARDAAAYEAAKRANTERLQSLANGVIVGQAALSIWSMIAGKVKEYGEEIINVTNIQGAFEGSLDQARAATQGTVDDLTLMTEKNRLLATGLKVTDEQFALLAGAADDYADKIGGNTTEALSGMTQNLAAGNDKLFKRLGIIVDNNRAEEKYAKSIGITSDQLDEEQKRIANAAEVFEQLGKRTADGLQKPVDMATTLEKVMVGFKNEWTGLLGALGAFKPPPWLVKFLNFRGFLRDSAEEKASKEKYGDMRNFTPEEAKAFRDRVHAEEAARAAARSKRLSDAIGGDSLESMGGEMESSDDPTRKAALERAMFLKTFSKKKAAEPIYVSPETVTGLDRLLYKAAIAEQEKLAKIREDAEQTVLERRLKLLEESGRSGYDIDYAPKMFATEERATDYASAQGKAAESLRRYGLAGGVRIGDNFAASSDRGIAGVSLRDARGSANLDEEFIKDLEAKIAESREKAGGGLLGQLLFGDDTTMDQTYDRLDRTKQAFIDAVAEMSEFTKGAAQQMAGALGQSLAASLGEDANFKKGLKERTHAVLMSLSAEAFTRAAMETAYGLAALAFPATAPTAPAHFAAAAAFGAVGVAAGIGARATYTAPASAGSTPTSVRGSSAGTGGGSSRGSGGDAPTIIFNINGMIGNNEDLIRKIGEGMDAYRRKTGRNPFGNN